MVFAKGPEGSESNRQEAQRDLCLPVKVRCLGPPCRDKSQSNTCNKVLAVYLLRAYGVPHQVFPSNSKTLILLFQKLLNSW